MAYYFIIYTPLYVSALISHLHSVPITKYNRTIKMHGLMEIQSPFIKKLCGGTIVTY